MSAKRITQPMLDRTVHIVDESGILDLLAPPPPANRRGRRGQIRENTRLWAIGLLLCTRLGHETTIKGVHDTLTSIPREMQWQIRALRPITTQKRKRALAFNPEKPTLTNRGKVPKEVWEDANVERVGYDDLVNAVAAMNKRLAYGNSVAGKVPADERSERRSVVQEISDRLITITSVPRTSSTVAIDATGQWAWNIGSSSGRTELEKKLSARNAEPEQDDAAEVLEVSEIAADESGETAPSEGSATAKTPEKVRTKCLDAAWGYKTGKSGKAEVGFGFHQHTIVRVPDPGQPKNSEPLLVEALAVVPANEDVVEASLGLLDRARRRSAITRVIGDLLYTNLKADRWAAPLAQRGIEQVMAMRSDNAKLTDIDGAIMQFGWMHCPAAPMDQRPLPATFAKDDTPEHFDAVDRFKYNWAFDRKESGLGRSGSTKWICPAAAGKVGCHARGPLNVDVARETGLPIVTPPTDWATRKSCTNKTLDFTPDPTKPAHQRKLMQREYYGSRRWRRSYNPRSLVEGAFGILKNPSRQRLRRGQNRVPGLVMANLVSSLKTAVFNEEQLRSWHEDTNLGPSDHPLLQPDPVDHGVTQLTKEAAEELDRAHLAKVLAGAEGTRDEQESADLAA
ncbi:MAG: hypothetical protein EOO27_05225 [Comamonadaceae bacterium]|nr:MAG: hypothetical protein EOO27_05225 [Comamonadaceae bacterium]